MSGTMGKEIKQTQRRIERNPEDLELILKTAMDMFNAGSASIMLPDEYDRLEIAASLGIDRAIVEYTCVEGTCSKGFGTNSYCVYITGKPRLVETEIGVVGVRYTSNSMCLPICWQDKIMGVFNLSNKRSGNFSESELELAARLLPYCAKAIHAHYKEPVERSVTAATAFAEHQAA